MPDVINPVGRGPASTQTGNTQALITQAGFAQPSAAYSVLLRDNIPAGIPSNGTMGNNGQFSGIAAQNAAYPNCYLFFPAGAILAGSLAGLYYCQMSSTSAGIVFNNLYAGGPHLIPSTPTPFSGTGPGAYTQTTGTAITLLNFTVPALAMGNNGGVRISFASTNSGGAGTKTILLSWAGTTLLSSNQSTNLSTSVMRHVANMGQANLQFSDAGVGSTGLGFTAATPIVTTADTSLPQPVLISNNLNTATDFATLLFTTIELFSSN